MRAQTLNMSAQGAFAWMRPSVVLLLCLCAALLSAASRTNYYDTLSVEPTATDNQIKKAFRKLAMKYHPDKNKSADAEETFREIAEGKKQQQKTSYTLKLFFKVQFVLCTDQT